jgi:hypothetical protein
MIPRLLARPRLHGALLLSVVAPLAAACIENDRPVDPPPAPPVAAHTFRDAPEGVRLRAIAAASGHDALLAEALVRQLPRFPEGGCPTVTESGDGLVYEGDCTMANGDYFAGRIRAVFGIEDADGGSTRLQFDDVELILDGERFEFDGTITRFPNADVHIELDADIDQLRAQTSITFECDGGTCLAREGATISVEGVGELPVEGELRLGAEPSGYVSLHAGDDLLADLGSLGGACGAYLIDDIRFGNYCAREAPYFSVPNDLEVTSSCADGILSINASSLYAYDTVEHARITGTIIVGGKPTELRDQVVALERVDDIEREHQWFGEVDVCGDDAECTCDQVLPRFHVVRALVLGAEVARETLR